MKFSTCLGLLASSSIISAGILAIPGVAEAADFKTGDRFRIQGNVFFNANQNDYVGPPNLVAPELGDPPPTPNVPGFFAISSASSGSDFENGIGQPPNPNTTGAITEIKDIKAFGTPGIINQEGPNTDGSVDPAAFVPEYLVFNNQGLPGGILDFEVELQTIQLLVNGQAITGAPDPTTPLTQISFNFTGELTDNDPDPGAESTFDAIGSITPNIGDATIGNLTLGQLNNTEFLGSVGYTQDWEITSQVTPPPDVPEPTSSLAIALATGLGFAFTRKAKKSNINEKNN